MTNQLMAKILKSQEVTNKSLVFSKKLSDLLIDLCDERNLTLNIQYQLIVVASNADTTRMFAASSGPRIMGLPLCDIWCWQFGVFGLWAHQSNGIKLRYVGVFVIALWSIKTQQFRDLLDDARLVKPINYSSPLSKLMKTRKPLFVNVILQQSVISTLLSSKRIVGLMVFAPT